MKLLLLIVLLFIGSFSKAQIVSIENPRLVKMKNGWSGDLNLSFALTSNTRQIVQLGNRNKIYRKKNHHLSTLITDFSFVAVDKENYVNNGFAHLRYAYNSKTYSKLFMEGFTQGQYNQIQLIRQRYLVGAGSRFVVLDLDSASISVGAFLMGEYEEESSLRINRDVRYSCFLSFDFQFNKTTGINSITYYQPLFLYPGDYRINSETSLRLKITEKLRFRLLYNIQYDTNPPLGAPKTIYSIQNAFAFVF